MQVVVVVVAVYFPTAQRDFRQSDLCLMLNDLWINKLKNLDHRYLHLLTDCLICIISRSEINGWKYLGNVNT